MDVDPVPERTAWRLRPASGVCPSAEGRIGEKRHACPACSSPQDRFLVRNAQ